MAKHKLPGNILTDGRPSDDYLIAHLRALWKIGDNLMLCARAFSGDTEIIGPEDPPDDGGDEEDGA